MPLGSALKKTNNEKRSPHFCILLSQTTESLIKAAPRHQREERFSFVWKKKKRIKYKFRDMGCTFRDLSRPFFPPSFPRFSRGSMFPRRLAVVYAPPPSHLPARLPPVLLNTTSQKFADVECGGIWDSETRQKQIDTRWGRRKGDWDPNVLPGFLSESIRVHLESTVIKLSRDLCHTFTLSAPPN